MNEEYRELLIKIVKHFGSYDIGVVAVKGIGSSISDAKKPLNFDIKEKYGSWEKFIENIQIHNRRTLELIKTGKANAIGVIGYPEFYIVDIDLYKIEDNSMKREIEEIIESLKNEIYIEKTPRGGYHLFFRKESENTPEITSSLKFVDIKYKGYVISYPSFLKVIENNIEEFYCYEKISKYDIIDLPELFVSIEDFPEIKKILQIEYTSETRFKNVSANLSNKKIENLISRSSEEYQRIESKNIFLSPLPFVKHSFNKINDTAIVKRFLVEYAKDILKCPGLAYSIEKWIETGKLPIPRLMVPMEVPRGSHFTAEVDIFTLLKELGVSIELLSQLAQEIQYEDGIYGSPPINTLKYTVLKGDYPIPAGFCPFSLTEKCNCGYTPTKKAMGGDYIGIFAYLILGKIYKSYDKENNSIQR